MKKLKRLFLTLSIILCSFIAIAPVHASTISKTTKSFGSLAFKDGNYVDSYITVNNVQFNVYVSGAGRIDSIELTKNHLSNGKDYNSRFSFSYMEVDVTIDKRYSDKSVNALVQFTIFSPDGVSLVRASANIRFYSPGPMR